jgi:hypothetical protein
MFRLHTDEAPASAATELRRRIRSRRVRFEGELEPSPAHGGGEVLDLFLWGTLRRTRGPIEIEVREAARDLGAIARDALPRATPDVHLDALPLEPAVFEPSPGGPDHIRLGFRVVASTPSQLKTWRTRLHDNLKALGVGGAARPPRPT